MSSENNYSSNTDYLSRSQTRLKSLIQNDEQVQKCLPKQEVIDALSQPDGCLIDLMEIAFEGYSDREAFGERAYALETNGAKISKKYFDCFDTITFRELQQRIKTLAAFWQNDDALNLDPGERVCIMGFSGIDYQIIDMACAYTHAVPVPIQSSSSYDELSGIVSNVEPALIAATINDIEIAAKHASQQSSVRQVIVFDYDRRDSEESSRLKIAQALLKEHGSAIIIKSLDELLSNDVAFAWRKPIATEGEERMATIVHSSGSTGTPKGAVLTEKAVSLVWSRLLDLTPIIGIGLAPLNHMLGRNFAHKVLAQGGTLYFTLKPDLSTLFEDMRITRPTQATFFPRILELIYQHYQSEVSRRLGVLNESQSSESENRIRIEVKTDMRNFLGDRLCTGAVAGAPIASEVQAFVQEAFDMILREAYSSTEAGNGGLTVENIVQRSNVLDYKLRDVPELGYYTTDKPYPRGEFCFKSLAQVKEYYRQPEATAALTDEEGFSLTGDIVEERGPDHVVVIDRRKDVLKLSQGEYVAIGKLGTMFETSSAVIKQIFIYGSSKQSYLVAVVVPNLEEVARVIGSNPEEQALRSFIREELQKVAHEHQLKSFEVPRDFIIENEPFSQENGLLSSVRKRLRPALKNRYGERLEAIYAAEVENQKRLYLELKNPQTQLSVGERLAKLLAIHLNLSEVDPDKDYTFAEWGGDSLASVSFALSIEEIFGISFAADAVLSPNGSLMNWAKQIEKQLSGDDDTVYFESVHDAVSGVIKSSDLQLTSFLRPEFLEQAKKLDRPQSGQPQCVLLTGANGFLGRFVCLEWLEKLSKNNGQLICLVRGADNQAARARLEAVFNGVDPELERRFKALAKDHLLVLAGDVSESRLGLAHDTFHELAVKVDRISHVAALVNHRLSYENLFRPNVVGTAELIGLALTHHQKAIDFVSTEAVFPLLNSKQGINERSPLLEEIKNSDAYAAGYGASKWASEHLLYRANEEYDLPVNIFRGDMMLAHSHYKGQINVDDIFSRLLFSLIRCGIAPGSFYNESDQGHYNGTPVDVVAACIVGAVNQSVVDKSNSSEFSCGIYNIENYHYDDGCSLDCFTDWIVEAGYRIEKMQDYSQWFKAFGERLQALPEQQRQQSAFEILSIFAQPPKVKAQHIGCDNFKALISSLDVGPEVPHLTKSYIQKCLLDLQLQGLISVST